MTRIMTNPELIKPGRKPPPRQSEWFCRALHNAAPGVFLRVTSPLLHNGAVIEQIRFQGRIYPPGVTLWVEGAVFLTNSREPTGIEMENAEQVIQWDYRDGFMPWYSFGNEIDETWDVRKVVAGSDMRIGIMLNNLSADDVDARICVRYTQ